jgi:cytochrome c556
MKTLLLSLAFANLASAAYATDPAATFKAVCESQAVKSEKLTTACSAGDMPRVVKDGDRFDARGIGAEINVLSANLHLINRG